jgi:hypothetical protein
MIFITLFFLFLALLVLGAVGESVGQGKWEQK